MIDINIEKEILEFYENHHNVKYSSLKPEWKNYLLNRFDDSKSIKESLYRIKYNIIERPKCAICGGETIFYGMKNYMFTNVCNSKDCKYKYSSQKQKNFSEDKKDKIKEKRKETYLKKYGVTNYYNTKKAKQTCLERYGVDNPAKYETFKNKYKQTCLERYGVPAFTLSDVQKEKSKQTCLERYGKPLFVLTDIYKEKFKETCLERYGVEHYTNREKAKQTCLERYGDEYYNNKEKAKETLLERYGDENYNNREKAKETCLEKYGVDHTFKCESVREKIHQTWLEKYGVDNPAQSEEVKNKFKQTCLERYGVDHIWKIREIHDHCWTEETISKRKETSLKNWGYEYPSQSPIIQDKMNNTKLKNHTFNSSKVEEESYILIKEKYPDVVRQYKSELYPFKCDFYIPSLDLYIECNYHWSHGGHIYDPNNKEDQQKLQIWESKKITNSFYKNAIKVWTIIDPYKFNISKQNKLNLIIFWKIEELKKWLDQ